MGRPIKKDKFGVYAGSSLGIKVIAFVTGGSSAVVGYINKQTGSRSYKVTTAEGTSKCKLVETIASAGEMTIVGFLGEDTVSLRKITSRHAIDFAGVKYKWTLVNSGSDDYISLTAV